jgi:hypothetical protein
MLLLCFYEGNTQGRITATVNTRRCLGKNAMKIKLSVIKADIAPVVPVVFITVFIRVVPTGANGTICAAFPTRCAYRP